MRLRKLIAGIAVLGLVALLATAAYAGWPCCHGKGKVTQTGSACCAGKVVQAGGTGCPMHQSMGKAGAPCPKMAKAGGCRAAMRGSRGSMTECCPAITMECGSMAGRMQCNMPIARCREMMRAYYETHGWLGIEMSCEQGQACTPKVARIVEGSPAQAAGFKVGDLLTSLNGIDFGPQGRLALQGVMNRGFRVGDRVIYTAKREGQIVPLQATLAEIPPPVLEEIIAKHLATSHPHKGKMQEKG